jgi:hypothetical protein
MCWRSPFIFRVPSTQNTGFRWMESKSRKMRACQYTLTLPHRYSQSTTTHSKRCGPFFAPTSIHSHIMVSLMDAQQYPPPTDLQTDAVRLCIIFQSQLNPEFLGAATELLSCVATLSPAEFRRHSRKVCFIYIIFRLHRVFLFLYPGQIIRLIEVTRFPSLIFIDLHKVPTSVKKDCS